MRIQDKEEQIISIRQKRDSLNDLLEELEDMKSEWYDSGASPEDMKNIRKRIRKVIYQIMKPFSHKPEAVKSLLCVLGNPT